MLCDDIIQSVTCNSVSSFVFVYVFVYVYVTVFVSWSVSVCVRELTAKKSSGAPVTNAVVAAWC